MMKRNGILLIAASLALCAAGCSGAKEAPAPAAQAAEASAYVTAFGAVRCAESPVLRLPVEANVVEVYVREGQTMKPNTPVLKIDMKPLLAEKERAGHETAALETAIKGYTLQIRQTEADLLKAREAAKKMNSEKLLGILDKLANAGSRKKRDAQERALLAYLRQIDSVGRYHDLLAFTRDRRNVRDNARPALLELKAGLEEACRARETDLNALRQKLEKAEADILPLREKTDIMEEITGGAILCGIGSLNAEGVLTTGSRPLALASAPGYAGPVAPGTALAAFEALDTLEIEVLVEEQLISGVAAGADVQLSPLYDKGTVWLGTVASVSGRAVTVNGETVIPVTVKSEDMALGPGYNVTVKIFQPK